MIIFVGSKIRGDFAREVAIKRQMKIEFVNESVDIQSQTNDILFAAKAGALYIIYDAAQYINEAEEIADCILKISKATSTKPVILIASLKYENILIRALLDRDIKCFIESYLDKLEQKDELEKYLTGYFDINEKKDIKEILKKQEEEKQKLENYKSIAVAGAMRRIGTTTQSIQLVKFLNFKGYKACYIQVNENKYRKMHSKSDKESLSYLDKLKLIYDVKKEDSELSYIQYEDIDMYSDFEKLSEILDKDYEYIVYDYGSYQDKNFNKTAFLKDDIKIFVCGSDISEIDYTIDILQNKSYTACKMIFSFTAEEEKEDLLKLISTVSHTEDKASISYFAPYTPNAFCLSEKSIYEDIFDIEDKALPQGEKGSVKKKKISLFKRKEKRR